MGIPEKINEIVATRKQRLPHIEKVERSIAEVQSVVKRLEYLHEQTKNPEVSSELEPLMKFPEVVDTIRLLDTSKFNRDYEAVHQTLKWLKKPFCSGTRTHQFCRPCWTRKKSYYAEYKWTLWGYHPVL